MRKATLYILAAVTCLLTAVSCASIGNPSGGPRDEDPPRFVSSTPEQGAVEVAPRKVVLTFDELVSLKDAFSKVVVSPPGNQAPRVSSLGKRVTVEFRDTLLPETTYTIDFGDAIVDNNEGNKLENFIYTFSTGSVLDTLMVSGMVLGAEDLAPAEGIYVGLHVNQEDSAFRKSRFDRIAKTDEQGRFTIGGLAPGNYRIYALEDKDNDLMWSSPEETLAFYDAVISPSSEQTVASDTIFDLLTGSVDTVMERRRTRFLPNNILLRSYNTGFKQQYMTKYERVDSTRLHFIFNSAADSLPVVEILDREGRDAAVSIEDVAVVERSRTNDTITYWLRDREIIGRDTLTVAMRYLRADSAYNMTPVSDTLRMITSRPVKKQEKKVRHEADTLPPPIPVMELKALNAKPEIFQPLMLEMPVPAENFDFAMTRLEILEDTLWKEVADFSPEFIKTDTINPRILKVDYPWEYETKYRFAVDSLAGKNIYGIFTDDFKIEFGMRAETEYGSLKFNLSNMGADSIPRFVDLLDSQGKPLRTLPLEEGSVTFVHLLPGKYNVRVVEDANGNMKWDPGNFDKGEQPDVAYYYPQTIELKANWDQETDWDVFSTPVDRMVPEGLRKKSNTKR